MPGGQGQRFTPFFFLISSAWDLLNPENLVLVIGKGKKHILLKHRSCMEIQFCRDCPHYKGAHLWRHYYILLLLEQFHHANQNPGASTGNSNGKLWKAQSPEQSGPSCLGKCVLLFLHSVPRGPPGFAKHVTFHEDMLTFLLRSAKQVSILGDFTLLSLLHCCGHNIPFFFFLVGEGGCL